MKHTCESSRETRSRNKFSTARYILSVETSKRQGLCQKKIISYRKANFVLPGSAEAS